MAELFRRQVVVEVAKVYVKNSLRSQLEESDLTLTFGEQRNLGESLQTILKKLPWRAEHNL